MECEGRQNRAAQATEVTTAPAPAAEVRRARLRDWARAILAAPDDWAILDTETTDRKRDSDIIDIALIDLTDRVLYTSLVQPTQPIHPEVVAKTRISEAQAARAPDFAVVYQRIQPILESRRLLVYNAEFDIEYILQPQIARQCGIRWEPIQAECLMLAYSEYRGERYGPHSRHPGEYVYHRFEDACKQMGVSTGSQVHRALPDCRQSLGLLQAIANSESTS
jgi:DNA polymerase III epsilon subunit-like protein